MENAVDALKIGFAVLVFIMALSLAMNMFAQARETSELVLHSSDVTEYIQDNSQLPQLGNETRIVGLETIIPTLYKYYKENYTVIFKKEDGSYLTLYETDEDNKGNWSTGYINKYYTSDESLEICSFDVDEETKRREPWTGGTGKYKENLDVFLSGGRFYNPNGVENDYYEYEGFINKYKNKKFREDLGEYIYNHVEEDTDADDSSSSLIKEKKKRVIIYTLLN